MSGYLKKAVVWLGLDEQYPENGVNGSVDIDLQDPDSLSTNDDGHSGVSSAMTTSRRNADFDTPSPSPRSADRDRDRGATVRAVPLDKSPSPNPTSSGTVRAVPLAANAKPETIVPSSFNNAQDVADIYKRSKPVVVDLRSAERDLARRLIDFAAGLCYGLGGQMEKLDRDRYLLIPEGVELSPADRRSLES